MLHEDNDEDLFAILPLAQLSWAMCALGIELVDNHGTYKEESKWDYWLTKTSDMFWVLVITVHKESTKGSVELNNVKAFESVFKFTEITDF